MWNQLFLNPVCFRKQTAQDQLRHITNIRTSKSCLNISSPWQSSHSLSKLRSKVYNIQEIEIKKSNDWLLSRMIKLQNNQKIKQVQNLSQAVSFPKRNKNLSITKENLLLLKRLQSTNTQYPLKLLIKDNIKNQKYKINSSRKNGTNVVIIKVTHEDFTRLAQKEQLRKVLASSQSQRNSNKKAISCKLMMNKSEEQIS